MKRRVKVQEKMALPSTKRRRLILKQERALTKAATETLEGQSYESGVGLEDQPDVEQLPIAVPHGSFKPVTIDSQQEPTFIMFDLETTDLIRGNVIPHITQIAAFEQKTQSKYNAYVKPKLPISSEAQRITGIVLNDSGNMCVNGESVESSNLTSAARSFYRWLSYYPNPVLVAHNGRRFDFPVLLASLESAGLIDDFFNIVIGFIDSLSVFRKTFPNENSYKQEELVKKHLGITYSAHNAVEDVVSLGHLFFYTNGNADDLMKYSFSPVAVKNQRQFLLEKCKNIASLSPLVTAGVMKRPTAENVAGSGLNFHHLHVIYQRGGEDGLHSVFTAKNREGQPRVTNASRVLEDIIPKLGSYFTNIEVEV